MTFIDLSENPDAEGRAEHIFAQEKAKPFDLARDLPVRFILIRLRRDLHWLLRAAHHIIGDKHSWDVVWNELGLSYETELSGEDPPLPEFAPLQYCDFAAWQRSQSPDPAVHRETIAWWKAVFEKAAASEPPFKRRRVAPEAAAVDGSIAFSLDSAVSRRLGRLRREQGATYFAVRLAAFAAMLAGETGRRDAVFGGYVSLRNQLALQDMLGDFSNLVMYRYSFEPALGFRVWLSQVRKRYVETNAHCILPDDELRIELGRAGLNLPWPHVIVQGHEPPRPIRFGELRVTNIGTGSPTMPWGFTFVLMGDDDDDKGVVSFDAGRYNPAAVRKATDRYCRFLQLASLEPDRPIGEVLKMAGSGGWGAWLRRSLRRY